MNNQLKVSASDIFHVPRISRRTLAVWRRNFRYFRQTLLTSLFWVAFEPVLYLLAVGYGLGQFVSSVGDVKYVDFFYPALLATTAMNVAFFETTYGSFTKLVHQKSFSTILLSPLSPDEIIFGEILWGASKGFFSVVVVFFVTYLFGLIHDAQFLPALLLLALTCWFFSALGMLMTSIARNYDSFIYMVSGFIVPMSLFSGTYFPTDSIPEPFKGLTYLLPLTHAVVPLRALLIGHWQQTYYAHIGILILLTILVTNWSISRLRRRLVN